MYPMIARSMIKLLEPAHAPRPARLRSWRDWLLWPGEPVAVAPPRDCPTSQFRAERS